MTLPCTVCRLPQHENISCGTALKGVQDNLNKAMNKTVVQRYRENSTVKELRDGITRVLIFAGERAVACGNCQAPIFWLTHNNGVTMPYNNTGLVHYCAAKGKL